MKTLTGRKGPDLLLGALAVVSLVYVWRIQSLFPMLGALQLPTLATGAALVLYALHDDARREPQHVDGPILRCLAGITILMAIGSFFAIIQTEVVVFFTRDWLPNIVLLTAVTAAAIRSERDLRWVMGVHLFGGVLFCTVVLLRFDVGVGGRLHDLVYYDSNDFGLLLVMCFPMALFFVLEGRRMLSRVLAGASMLLFLVVLVKTGSRGAFVGFCVVGLWIVVKYRSIPLSRRVGAVVVALMILVASGTDAYWSLMETMLRPTQDYNWAGNSEEGRIEVWKRGVGYLLERPLVGVGAKNFDAAEGHLSEEAELADLRGEGWKRSSAHNSFLEIAVETGVMGLVLFLMILMRGLRISRAPPPASGRGSWGSPGIRQALGVSLIGYMVTGFFLSAAYDPILYAALGLLVAVAKLDRLEAGAAEGRSPTWTRSRQPAPPVGADLRRTG